MFFYQRRKSLRPYFSQPLSRPPYALLPKKPCLPPPHHLGHCTTLSQSRRTTPHPHHTTQAPAPIHHVAKPCALHYHAICNIPRRGQGFLVPDDTTRSAVHSDDVATRGSTTNTCRCAWDDDDDPHARQSGCIRATRATGRGRKHRGKETVMRGVPTTVR